MCYVFAVEYQSNFSVFSASSDYLSHLFQYYVMTFLSASSIKILTSTLPCYSYLISKSDMSEHDPKFIKNVFPHVELGDV